MSRESRYPHTCSDNLSREFVAHAAAWNRSDSWCDGQWADARPGELPSQPATTSIAQAGLSTGKLAFAKFDFGRWA